MERLTKGSFLMESRLASGTSIDLEFSFVGGFKNGRRRKRLGSQVCSLALWPGLVLYRTVLSMKHEGGLLNCGWGAKIGLCSLCQLKKTA